MSTEITSEELTQHIQTKIPLLILDTRDQESYMDGHIEGSANAKCTNMQEKQIIMSKIPPSFKIVLVDDDGSEASKNAQMMASFGFDAHHLKDGIKSWNDNLVKSTQKPTITNQNLWESIKTNDKDVFLLDVREPQEFSEFKIPGAVNIPLSELFAQNSEQQIPKNKKIVTICSHGNRSMVATFALAQKGMDATSLEGGMSRWNQVLNHTKLVKEDNDGLDIIQIEKVGKGCLSHIINSKGEAIVIDPTHPTSKYIDIAKNEGFKISKVIDTHQHADHVSAAKDLAKLADAELYFSAKEEYNTPSKKIDDGDIIQIGDKQIKVIHTPGHTAGSMTLIVDDKFAFCGDILFIDEVGRPDLRDNVEKFASNLHNTLHNKILQFSSNVKIFPSHHNEQTKPTKNGIFYTTIDIAKKLPMLNLDKDEFVKRISKIITPKPMNYSLIIRVNKGQIPIMSEQIPDLEMGPNRCSVKI
jgi:glyoxylase-like metal-dependent hydrolase (beta-lactamase superfamily II)/rhodanese-related sulfurtransferase